MTSPLLALRPAADCRWDCVALGEVMLRFDPGFGRVRNARSFQVWEGGGEYNVARALRKTFGLRSSVVTALPKNDLGLLVEDLILQGGVDVSHLIWRPFDGVGRDARVGLNFTEKGFGVRPPLGVSDRAHSAASQIRPGEVDWDRLFGEEGVRWLHTGGIFAALSASTGQAALEAVKAARRHGAIVSYDMNYRPSLWKSHGDKAEAQRVNREIAAHVDVMIGGEFDFATSLGFETQGLDPDAAEMDGANFRRMAEAALTAFPNFKVIARTLRGARSANVNDWGAILWVDGAFHEARRRDGLELYDRVGGGDAFASGMIFALMEGMDAQPAVDYGAAHGALAMTTPGDTSMVSREEVEAAIRGASVRVDR
jgi:2-dehydro-3-deoxygluconokinase